MRKNLKANAINITSINTVMDTACYQNVKSVSEEGIEYEPLGEYKGITDKNYKVPGNEALSTFREKMISLRTQLKVEKIPEGFSGEEDKLGFKVNLKLVDEKDSDKEYYIIIGVYRKIVSSTNGSETTYSLGNDEYGRIMVLTNIKREDGLNDTNKYYYGMKDLIVDSDVDDRIWRFVGENEWRSTTYMILDLNKNLSINKGAYLTLNLPFCNNIGWYEPMRKCVDGWHASTISTFN